MAARLYKQRAGLRQCNNASFTFVAGLSRSRDRLVGEPPDG
jgi:hypothetical protein